MSSPPTPPTRDEINQARGNVAAAMNAQAAGAPYFLRNDDVRTILSALSAAEEDVKRLEHVCQRGFLSIGEGRPGFFACKTMEGWRKVIDCDIECEQSYAISPGAGE